MRLLRSNQRSPLDPKPQLETNVKAPKKFLPPAIQALSQMKDSFESGRPGSRPSGGASLSGDVFQFTPKDPSAPADPGVLDPNTGNFPPGPPPMTADGRVIPQANDKRPEGDDRSAKQIVDDSPPLAHLGRQQDIEFGNLCDLTGVNPDIDIRDAKQDPDAVYRLSKVLEFIDASPDCEGNDRPGKVTDGKGDGNIEGITHDGEARHGTEAGLVKDFAEKGYDFLKSQATLPTTTDPQVAKDGSNQDNFQYGAGLTAKYLFFIPAVSNVLAGIGNSKGGAAGAIEGALGGALHTVKDNFEGVIDALRKGRVNPFLLGLNMYKSELADGTATPDAVKNILDKLP